jgi:hypothetical protein
MSTIDKFGVEIAMARSQDDRIFGIAQHFGIWQQFTRSLPHNKPLSVVENCWG